MIKNRFLNPVGKGFGLFIFKFLLFSLLAWVVWTGVRIPYNLLLKNTAVWICNRSLPMIDYRFTPDRGTFEVMFRPDTTSPLKLIKSNPVPIKIYFNTLHFNIIPFLALILASPLTSIRRIVVYLCAGSVILVISHHLHMYLDFKAYYYRIQKENGYFQTGQMQATPEILNDIRKWKLKTDAWGSIQGFMEQAGSMIVPAFIWMVYASGWLFRVFLNPQVRKETLLSEKHETSEQNQIS